MPELTRRLTWRESPDDWSIFYGDIAVGRIMRHPGDGEGDMALGGLHAAVNVKLCDQIIAC